MATNEEVLGPKKTMIVLVIVGGCFAVLWPRILSPLLMGQSPQLEPNQFDRDAGCCEVIFETEVAFLELVSEICQTSVGADGKLSPYAASECLKSVNETCGVDIAAFLKRSNNVGKNTKMLFDTLKMGNSTCLRENFGVPVWSLSSHTTVNAWKELDIKQERPLRGLGPHPALRERGRAIPANAPTPPSRVPVPLPPHIRPPPIPGMRPPLGSPGGPVPPPKSSMGFVMPIYTICIIVFFVYTLSKILFKRTDGPYESISPDPQFRRRVFRDDSRTTPEPKLVVTAISGLVAEVRQQMETSYVQNQQRQDVQDNHARPYTNGGIKENVRIIATEYKEPIPELKEPTPEPKERTPEKEPTPEPKEETPEPKEQSPEPKEQTPEPKEATPEPKEPTLEPKEPTPEPKELTPEPKEETPEPKEQTPELNDKKVTEDFLTQARETRKAEDKQTTPELLEEALREMGEDVEEEEIEEEVEEEEEEEIEPEKSTVRVLGMETTAHAADGGAWPSEERHVPPSHHKNAHSPEDVKSIFLETEIPQQSKVLVADFVEQRADSPAPAKNSSLIVSGKMTLSLIQDMPRDTPDRELESTVDEYTTASAITQPAENKDDDLSEEEIEEEIEIEEIEEEVEEVEEVEESEEEEEEPEQPKK